MGRIVDALELPKDLCLGAFNIKLIGQYEVYVENYRSIIEYNSSDIKLQGKHNRLSINGRNLRIICFTKDDMRIKGFIQEVKFY